MSLSQLVLDAIDRLKQYNLGIYNAVSNRFGLSGVGGMNANWSRHSKDIATACEAVGTLADAASASQTAAAGSATAAAGSALAAAGDAQAAHTDRLAADADAQATAADRQAVATDKATAHTDRLAADADAAATAADRQAVATDKAAVHADRLAADADAQATAADRVATAADRATVAADKGTVQSLAAQTLTARDQSAASAVLAQQFVGAATNVITPAINYRLASAWDANGQPTQYALTGVVAVHRCDTRLDWDRGAWRKGKLARATGWWNEPLNTNIRGAKREPPVVPLVVLTTSMLVIYDAHDLDANGSPRMWAVANGGSGGVVPISAALAPTSLSVRAGRILIGINAGILEIDLLRDAVYRYGADLPSYKAYRGRFTDRSASSTTEARGPAVTAGLVSSVVNSVDLRVLPGAPLDPVSRLPIPTIAAATAGGVSVIHPTGLVATISSGASIFARFTKENRLCWGTSSTYFYFGPIPYTNYASSNALATEFYCRGDFSPVNGAGLRYISGNQNSAVCLTEGAVGHPGGLTLLERDPANPATGMVSYISKDCATGWLPGDTRLCVITEGAGSNGAAVTGTGELIVNGGFDTDTVWNKGTGWAISGGVATKTAGTAADLNQMVGGLIVGQTYFYSVTITARTAGSVTIGRFGVGPYISGIAATGTFTGQFVADATSQYFGVGADAAFAGSVDNVSVKLCIPDRSYKGKGLIPAGTLTRTPVATGSDLCWLSGYGASAYAMQPYNADYDFGAGDFFFSFWMMNGNNGGDFFDRYSGSGARIRALVSSGKLNFLLSDGTNSVSPLSTTDVAGAATAGIVRKFDLILRRATQTAEIWINGVLEASASTSALGSLTNTSATFTLGNTYALNNPLALGSLCLFRAGAYAPTHSQIRRMYADEAALFQAGAKAFLGGASNSVQSLALDEDTGVLAVGTADGVSQFAGLRRVGRLTQAAGTAFTVASVISLSAGGGTLLVGTASEAGVVADAMPIKDYLLQSSAATDTDATSTNLAAVHAALFSI